MTHFRRSMLVGLAGILIVAVSIGVLAKSVSYKPYGVPDILREKYDAKIAEVKQREKLLSARIGDSTDPSELAPLVSFNKLTHDFGRLDPHQTATYSFTATNRGTAPLALALGETSCKCTVGSLKKQMLQPGESTQVKLEWNAGYKAEEYSQNATVITNDPLSPKVTLTVKGTIRSDLTMPDSLTLTSVNLGENATGHLTIYSQLWDSFSVEDVRSDMEDFHWFAEPLALSATSLIDKEPTSAIKLNVQVPVFRAGESKTKVTVVLAPDNGSANVEKELTIHWKSRSPIAFVGAEVHPKTGVDLGLVESGQRREIPMVVRLRAEKDRTLAVLDQEPKELDIKLTRQASGNYRLVIAVPEDCPQVIFNRQDQHGYVQVGDPKEEGFQNWLPIYGAVVKSVD